jgi:hypothetical protein
MAYGISAYFVNNILNHCFRNAAFTPPATIYARMHTGDPGAAGTANASAQTTRYAVSFSAASGGAIALASVVDMQLNATETIAGLSYWDAASGGNFLWSAQATVAKGGISGDYIRILTNPVSLGGLAA